jgi:hypothetical protein
VELLIDVEVEDITWKKSTILVEFADAGRSEEELQKECECKEPRKRSAEVWNQEVDSLRIAENTERRRILEARAERWRRRRGGRKLLHLK